MAIIAVGSLAFDSVKTIFGEKERMLGGSLTHFSNAAAFLSKPRLVGVVGGDFTDKEWGFLKAHSSSVEGVAVMKDEKSFFWQGHYSDDFNTATTVKTELNAFGKFSPAVPDGYKKGAGALFLANIDPVIQREVALQCAGCGIRILDTMNYWIEQHGEALKAAFRTVNGIVINEGEAFLRTKEKNAARAAEKLFNMYPNLGLVIVKKGSNGVMVFGANYTVTLPAYPVNRVVDPTGAGDSFAGAFVSWLDSRKVRSISQQSAKAAAVYATVVASFAVEGFGVEGISGRTPADIAGRLSEFRRMAGF